MLDTLLVLCIITALAAFALPTRTEAPTPTPDTSHMSEAERIIAALEAQSQAARS